MGGFESQGKDARGILRICSVHTCMNANESCQARVAVTGLTSMLLVTWCLWTWVMSHVNESCHACEWVMSLMWMSNVTHVWQSWGTSISLVAWRRGHEPCHACEWDLSRTWMRHVKHVNESCHEFEWDMSRMCGSHEAREHTVGDVMYVGMSHVTHVNETCHKCKWDMSRMWMSHVTHVWQSRGSRAYRWWRTWTLSSALIREGMLRL